MDNLLDILIPLIIAGIYFFGNMMSSKSEGENNAPKPRRKGGIDPDAAERQRRIQEEIRRKIMERRQASEGGGSAQPAPVGQELGERRPQVEAHREMRQAQKKTREVVHESREVPSPFAVPTPGREDPANPAAFSWDESDNAYDDSMQAQLKQIEETKRRAEKLKQQAAEKRRALEEPSAGKRRTGGYFSGSIRQSLKDPAAARVAFIYGEVLGQPISLRKGSSSVPGLN